MDERNFCPLSAFFKKNLEMRIGRVVREFCCAPGLNDALMRYQFERLAEDVSIPGAELSCHFAIYFCRTACHRSVAFGVQPGFIDLCRLGADGLRKSKSIFHFMPACVFRRRASHVRSWRRDGRCSATRINLPAEISPWSVR